MQARDMTDEMPLLQTLSRADAVQLLPPMGIGRLVFTEDALPAVIPVSYALDGEAVVVRTGGDSRIARHGVGGVVAFEVDDIEPAVHAGWSVVVTGACAVVTDAHERERLCAMLTPWVGGGRDLVLRIPMTVVTGRRLLPHRQG